MKHVLQVINSQCIHSGLFNLSIHRKGSHVPVLLMHYLSPWSLPQLKMHYSIVWTELLSSRLLEICVPCLNCCYFAIIFKFVTANILLQRQKQITITRDELTFNNYNQRKICRYILHHENYVSYRPRLPSTDTHTRTHTHKHIYITNIYIYIYVCVCVCVGTCICIYIYIYIYIGTCVCMYIYIYIYIYTRTYLLQMQHPRCVLCILGRGFIRVTTCFGHCGPSSGHKNV